MRRVAQGTAQSVGCCISQASRQHITASCEELHWTVRHIQAACGRSPNSRSTTPPASFSSRVSAWHCSSKQSFSSSAVATNSRGKKQSSSNSSAAFVFALPCLFTAFLGTWQIQRRKVKVDLVQARTLALQGDGVELNELPPRPAEFTRVHIQGEFDHASSLYVGPRPRSSMGSATNGYMLITPVHSDEWNKPVLVNRGWVPATWRSDPAFRQQWETPGSTSLETVTRVSEDPSSFVPENKPKAGEWFWIDVPAMATSLGLPADTPLVEAVSVSQPKPVGSSPTAMDVLGMRTNRPLNEESYPIVRSVSELMTFKVTPDDHRNYSLTWYTLSAATGTMAYGIFKKQKGR